MANIYYAIPPGPDVNPFWADLDDRLGVSLKLQMVPAPDYAITFPTTIAGNDLPDLLQLQPPPTAIPSLPALLKARFTDLSEHLSGDAILDYPNLANVSTRAWQTTVYNGGIYGIPIPRGAMGSYNFCRQDLFEKYGANPMPKSYDEFVEVTQQLTNDRERRWAFPTMIGPRGIVSRMNGEPNVWRNEGGKLTRAYETDEFKQTVTDLRAVWESGVIHPDAFTPTQPSDQLFLSGRVAMSPGGYLAWNQYTVVSSDNPTFKLGLMPTYQRTGGQLAHWAYAAPTYSFTALKQQDSPDKIKMLLRVLNWLAAPFGTTEYFFRLFGAEGRDHKLDGKGNPVLTAGGTANTVLPIRYLADSPSVIYQPGRPQDVDTQHEYQSLEIPTGLADPTLGLFSDTNATRGGIIEKAFTDGVNGIIQGRRPVSSLDELISAWKSGGGDAIRAEYQDQLQSAGSAPR